MKKILKNPIFTFILGAVIFGGIGTVLAVTYLAKDVSYTPKDTTWKVDNVEDAIDDLYEKANKGILKEFNLAMRNTTYSTSALEVNYMLFNTKIPQYYSYFKITNVSCNEYVNVDNGGYYTYGDNNGTYVVLSKNVEYSFNNYSNIWTVVKSTTNGKVAFCDVKINFYNK